jgi:hypothetical protein
LTFEADRTPGRKCAGGADVAAKREGDDGITEREVTVAAGRRTDGEGGVMSGIQTRLEGATLVVWIPMRFQHRNGRKRTMAPDGTAIVPASKPQPDGTLVKSLARAWRWQRQLDEEVHTSVSDIAEAEGISKSYVI